VPTDGEVKDVQFLHDKEKVSGLIYWSWGAKKSGYLNGFWASSIKGWPVGIGADPVFSRVEQVPRYRGVALCCAQRVDQPVTGATRRAVRTSVNRGTPFGDET
jgi:hypothetical protein